MLAVQRAGPVSGPLACLMGVRKEPLSRWRRSIGAILGLAVAAAWTAYGDAFVSPLQGRPAPELASMTWINSTPLKLQDLRGKVVLLEFWTYG